MSNYGHEYGTLKLPTAAVPKVKKALRDAHNGQREALKSTARDFWRNHAKRTKSPDKYQEALRKYMGDRHQSRLPLRYSYRAPTPPFNESALWETLERAGREPHQAVEADIDAVVGPKATNKTTAFRAGEAHISIEGTSLTWSVPENNHAVEYARGSAMGCALFATLAQVNWTRATGGKIIGNDEYNREAEYEGGGGNYVNDRFGPLGDDSVGSAAHRARARTARAKAQEPSRGGVGSNQFVRKP